MKVIAKGIDVSEHQGVINWDVVKSSGLVDYAIIRCGYGSDFSNQDDKQFKRNMDECIRLGIPVGVYLYSYAKNVDMAKSEAQHVLRMLKGYTLQYPVYYDLEDSTQNSLSVTELANMAEVFCNAIEKAGYWVGIYANLSWWNNRLTDSRFSRWTKWVAQYNSECYYKGEYAMWQYSSQGSVQGVSGNVDVNYQYSKLNGMVSVSGASEATTVKADPATVDYAVHCLGMSDYLPKLNSSSNDFAGRNNLDKAIDGISCYGHHADAEYQVHLVGGSRWLSVVVDNKDYAGIYGKGIDGFRIKLTHTSNDVKYQVYADGRWLPWVYGKDFNKTGDSSYAGIYGKPIKAIRIKIV